MQRKSPNFSGRLVTQLLAQARPSLTLNSQEASMRRGGMKVGWGRED